MAAKSEGKQHEDGNEKSRQKAREEPPMHFFEVLARGGKEALIYHNEQVYRLRVTKNGKLILNK